MDPLLTTKSTGLTLEEVDIINDSINSDIFNVFIKLCQKISADIHKDVLQYTLTRLNEESLSELAYRKMKAQGAEKLVVELKALQEAANKQRRKNKQ